MKFITSTILILIITFINTFSQIGEKGGLNLSNTIFEDYSDNNIEIKSNNSMLLGVQAGAYRRFCFYTDNGGLYLDLSAMLNINRSLFDLTQKSNGSQYQFTQNFINVNVPVMIGYKSGFVRFFAGPSINTYLLSLTNEITSQYASYFDFIGQISPSICFGFGFDIGSFTIDIDYQHNLTGFNQELVDASFSQDPIPLPSVNNIISINFGYFKN